MSEPGAHLFARLRGLRLARTYFLLLCLYGLSTLVIPFATQFLVNDLALTGLRLSTYSFIALIALALLGTAGVKYAQTVLVEYLQRRLFYGELVRWRRRMRGEAGESPYFFEHFALMKTFASVVSDGADLALKSFFGSVALAFIHPGFLSISALFGMTLLAVRGLGRGALGAARGESNAKYELYHAFPAPGREAAFGAVGRFLLERDRHFGFIRRQSLAILLSFVVLQVVLLAWGVRMIQTDQLSIGQLVSAELILSSIGTSFGNLPKVLRNFYEFETSCAKLAGAAGGHAR